MFNPALLAVSPRHRSVPVGTDRFGPVPDQPQLVWTGTSLGPVQIESLTACATWPRCRCTGEIARNAVLIIIVLFQATGIPLVHLISIIF